LAVNHESTSKTTNPDDELVKAFLGLDPGSIIESRNNGDTVSVSSETHAKNLAAKVLGFDQEYREPTMKTKKRRPNQLERQRKREMRGKELAAKLLGIDLESISESIKPEDELVREFLGLDPGSIIESRNNGEAVSVIEETHVKEMAAKILGLDPEYTMKRTKATDELDELAKEHFLQRQKARETHAKEVAAILMGVDLESISESITPEDKLVKDFFGINPGSITESRKNGDAVSVIEETRVKEMAAKILGLDPESTMKTTKPVDKRAVEIFLQRRKARYADLFTPARVRENQTKKVAAKLLGVDLKLISESKTPKDELMSAFWGLDPGKMIHSRKNGGTVSVTKETRAKELAAKLLGLDPESTRKRTTPADDLAIDYVTDAKVLAAKVLGLDPESMRKTAKPEDKGTIEYLGLGLESISKSTTNEKHVAETLIRKEMIGSRLFTHLNLRSQMMDLHPELKEAMEDPNFFHGIKSLASAWTKPSQPASQHPAVLKVLRDIKSRQ
jgi:bifunctional DNA-binding transcriptional regulator/antitoxin component of YhaV-PrlF toxin-antitoxin module